MTLTRDFGALIVVWICTVFFGQLYGAEKASDFDVIYPTTFEYLESHSAIPDGDVYIMSVGSVRVKDLHNFRLKRLSATTIDPKYIQNGMNLILVETTQIASGTELLKLSRQTEPFKAEFPSSRESLEKLANELDKCDLSLKLYSKPKVPFGETHLSKLHVFTDFSIPFLQGSSNTLDLTEIRVDATKPDRRLCDLSKGGVQFHGEFEKFQGNWRLLHSSQQSRPASSRSQQKKEDIVSRLISVCDIKYVNQNGFEVTSKSEAIYSSGKKGGSTSNMVATGMTFGGTVNALLTEVIPNGTRVFLDGQEQIKAVWQDGKVVRVYHKGTIDDLSQSQFASTGGRNFETYFWLLLCFIAIPLIVVILNRLNRKKKQQPGFRSIP